MAIFLQIFMCYWCDGLALQWLMRAHKMSDTKEPKKKWTKLKARRTIEMGKFKVNIKILNIYIDSGWRKAVNGEIDNMKKAANLWKERKCFIM
jgi:hypothetical protein